MPCNEESGPAQLRLRTFTTSEYFYNPCGPWRPVVGVDAIRAAIKVVGPGANDSATAIGVQYAKVKPEDPSAWLNYGTGPIGANEGCVDTRIFTDAADKMWFRLGIASKVGSGGAVAQGDYTLDASWNACGRIVDSRTFEVFTPPVGKTGTYVLTDWLPTADIHRVKAGIEFFAVEKSAGTFNFRLAMQTADAEVEAPGSWTAIGSSYTDASSTPLNTGEIALTATSAMWVRFALQYWQTSSGLSSAVFNTVLGVRKGMLDAPSDWGTEEGGLQTPGPRWNGARIEYFNANNPYGDTYDTPAKPWSLIAQAETVGDPSGPGAWPDTGGGDPYWLGYDASTGKWGVYTGSASVSLVSGTDTAGPPDALTKVAVSNDATPVATFSISTDGGVTWTQLYSLANALWKWRVYVVQDLTTFSVEREQRA